MCIRDRIWHAGGGRETIMQFVVALCIYIWYLYLPSWNSSILEVQTYTHILTPESCLNWRPYRCRSEWRYTNDEDILINWLHCMWLNLVSEQACSWWLLHSKVPNLGDLIGYMEWSCGTIPNKGCGYYSTRNIMFPMPNAMLQCHVPTGVQLTIDGRPYVLH